MCGIAGIMNKGKHGNPMGERTLIGLHKAMTVQKHRGPDDSGVCAFQIPVSYTHLRAHETSV